MFASKDVFLTPPSTSGYTIGKSVRLRSSASAYLNRTFSVSANPKAWTWSAWIKRGQLSSSSVFVLYSAQIVAGASEEYVGFNNDTLRWADGSAGISGSTTAVFRDPSAWYHIVVVYDSANATAANRLLFYVNGVLNAAAGASIPQNRNSYFTSSAGNPVAISRFAGIASNYFDGYLTEINFIDGQALTPSSFGTTNATTGVWQPAKYTGTYGTNGFYLNFSSNSTSAALGTDFSGNSNTWTVNNVSVTAGVTYDSMVDSPTVSAVSSNYCVLNPIEKYSGLTVADGNLKVTSSDNTQYGAAGTLAVSSGKWYYEAMFSNASVNNMSMGLTTTQNNVQTAQWAGSTGMFMCGNFVTGTAIYVGVNGSYTQVSTTLPSAGSYLVCAVDYDNGKAWFGTTTSSGGAVTWYPASTGGSVGDPAAGTNPTITFSTTYPIRPFMGSYGAGLNWIANFGQRPFITTAPTGYNSWNTYNLPASTITNGAAYMAATTYTGNGGSTQTVSNAVNGISFQPDLVWIKDRSVARNNDLMDSIRGAGNGLFSNLTNAEVASGYLSSFNSNGFTTGNDVSTNGSGETFVGWQWKAGGTSSSNTNGSITSTVSVGATQGFSVVTYTGTGANATVGHGLGVAPSLVIAKNRTSGTPSWRVYHSALPYTSYLYLDTTSAAFTGGGVWTQTPSSTVIGINGSDAGVGSNGANYVAYCFSAVAGFSKAFSYTGNGSTDGSFVYLGFRPRMVLLKRTDTTGNWYIWDTSRNTYNVVGEELYPNLSNAGSTATDLDILSNGFKMRNTTADFNANGGTYIGFAWAENPFKLSLAR